jgi:transcriptional regulator with XRE-family HTH domain/quercetin dioxygenase-like cupin family protein
LPVFVNSVFEYSKLRLGHTIREQRKSKGWTLQELAALLGISSANLSAIENEKVVLDIERVVAIAEALGVRPDTLFPKNDRRHFHVVRQTNLEGAAGTPLSLLDRRSGLVTQHHNLLRPLADVFVGKHMEPFHVDVLHVPDDKIQFISHHSEEFLFVLQGQVEYLVRTPDGQQSVLLNPGDCMYLRSNLPHCLRSADGQKARIISVMHSPYGSGDSENGESTIYFKEGAPKNLTEEVADKMASLRQGRGLSMGEFARQLDISVRQVAEIERGRKPMSLDLLMNVCRHFQKPLEYFISNSMVERPYYFIQRASEIRNSPVHRRRKLVDAGWSETQFRSLASGFGPRGMYPYYVKLRHPDGGNITLHEHHGQEFAYVLNGRVTLVTLLNGKRVTETLTAGDTCLIDSTVPHRFLGMGLSPYDESSAEIIDVYWCPLGESYLFDDNAAEEQVSKLDSTELDLSVRL